MSDNGFNIDEWYKEKRDKAYATGWRPHGLSVGDKVKFHCEYNYVDDDLWEMINGKERPIEMKVEHNAVGKITELLDLNTVRVELPCVIFYFGEDDCQGSYQSTQVIEGDVLTSTELKELHEFEHAFKIIKKKKVKSSEKQLSLFD